MGWIVFSIMAIKLSRILKKKTWKTCIRINRSILHSIPLDKKIKIKSNGSTWFSAVGSFQSIKFRVSIRSYSIIIWISMLLALCTSIGHNKDQIFLLNITDVINRIQRTTTRHLLAGNVELILSGLWYDSYEDWQQKIWWNIPSN